MVGYSPPRHHTFYKQDDDEENVGGFEFEIHVVKKTNQILWDGFSSAGVGKSP